MTPSLYQTLYGPDSLNFKLFMAINHAHHPLLDPVMEALIYLGGSRIVYLYAALLLGVALARREWLPLRYVAVFCIGTAVGIGFEELLKGTFQVPRPGLAIGLDKIIILGEVKLRNSFPSGHAIFAFVTASTLSWRRGTGWKVPLYSFAALVAYSRVYVGAHYPLDVAAGAVVGVFTGFVVWKGYESVAARTAGKRDG
ncbi:phosphatase PAP2 family protein [Geobacter sp.]|uniref:phosphatase PAP2 family protein n=1 Tax=Geobacter sp. TaxID=46610 RepID=UPI002627889F|nr:phosphatase PAP2 family protein [Geobacter sp.]